MKHQRGMLLIAAVLLIVIAAVLSIAILTLTAGSAGAGAQHLSSTQAYFIAESGLEKAMQDWKNGTFSSTGTITSGNVSGSYSALADTLGFTGATLPSGQGHIKSTGTIAATGSSRTLEAIVQQASTFNLNFNDPTTSGATPTGWSPAGIWADTGGPDGSRAAYVNKPSTGSAVSIVGTYTFSPAVTLTASGGSLTISFDYLATGNTNGNQIQIDLIGSTTYTGLATLTGSGSYTSGTVTITGVPSSISVTSLRFTLTAGSGQARSLWLDNLALSGTTGGSVVQILDWRETIP